MNDPRLPNFRCGPSRRDKASRTFVTAQSPESPLSRKLANVALALIGIAQLTMLMSISAAAEKVTTERFSESIEGLLAQRCLQCHSGAAPEGGLNLTHVSSMLSGGESGPALVPGNVEESLLWQLVRDGAMPPPKPATSKPSTSKPATREATSKSAAGETATTTPASQELIASNRADATAEPSERLTEAELEVVRRWIADGAPWAGGPIDPFRFSTAQRAGYDWWSLQPLHEQPAPPVADPSWSLPIDAWVWSKLQEHQLQPAPRADRRTLIRRVTVDLTGLPATPSEIAAFLADPDDDATAYAQVVDRLLASPHYGERWARYWLDVVRFGESNGFEYDEPRDHAWHYRNWVIDAWNQDLPYDEFVRQQLAGDVLRPEEAAGLAASGFLVAGPHNTTLPSSTKMQQSMQQDEYEDLVAVVGQSFLGLTINCARCHDHKFDPITQTDYYRMVASLAGVAHGERDLPAVRTDSQDAQPTASPATGQGGQAEPPVAAKIYTVKPSEPPLTHVLLRGSIGSPTDLVSAGGIAAVARTASSATAQANSHTAAGNANAVASTWGEFGLPADAPEAQRRLRLAEWMTTTAQPLLARVICNRLWHYHFGQGLVNTPNDFGFNGGRPSHPELLEHLASQLIRDGWRLKSLQRRLVTSATYCQSTLAPATGGAQAADAITDPSTTHGSAATALRSARAMDADNRWLWRMAPRRLEAEVLRDTMLSVSGELNREVGGRGYRDVRQYFYKGSNFYELLTEDGPQFNRRTIYRFMPRGGRNPLLDTFDCPDPSATTPQRGITTTPLQALALWNNPFVFRMAQALAERGLREAAGDERLAIERISELCYGRPASVAELETYQAFAQQHGLAALCRVIFNSNEFLYVD